MNSQSSASDWIKTLAAAADAAPVYLGSKFFLIPYSEVSAAGNGAFYQAPTADGPVAEAERRRRRLRRIRWMPGARYRG